MKKNITVGEKYGYVMKIKTQEEADRYFNECVEHTMSFGNTREEAEKIEMRNIGYYAGYYDSDTRNRVYQLFQTRHPILGKI